MDLELSDEQVALDEAVAKLLDSHAGSPELLRRLDEAGYLDVVRDGGPVEGVLVVERAAEAQAASPVAGRVLAGPLAGITDLPPAVGLLERTDGALCRHAPACEAFLVVDGSRALLARRDQAEVEPVESTFGAAYGRVRIREGADLGPGSGDRLRRSWQVAIGAEAEGAMLAAIVKTARHVTERYQFGRPIGSFQSVQHRLAGVYSMALATRWLARRGAVFVDDEFVTASAAAYACEAAQATFTNLHQVCGAIGLTEEFGLVGWTTRLLALRQELGGQRNHARRVSAVRRAMDKPWPSPVPLPEQPGRH
jgi:alkylation response protein AidB-like acyl-CoA dehydrogenase